ncbi:hypothetical protein [Clostridium neonatale]|uniref:hypothetical protein n=1 Tax=Clostridium neonatale TaxID=137838 RepID=UPI00291B6745|nr:putative phage tail fiber protein [Clostridium neonatale]
MSKSTKNYKLFKYEDNDNADLTFLGSSMDIIDGGLSPFFVATLDSSNTYKVTTGLNLTELKNGFSVRVAIPSASTGATSLIIDSISAIAIKKVNGNAVSNLKANGVYSLTYYNGNFILASGSDDSDSTSVGTDGSNVKTGITFVGTDGEIHTGVYTADGTMVASDLLSGKVGYSKGNKITGTIIDQGAKTASLNCGGSYTIPAGYHNGSGKVTANSLASQTPANATAAQILAGYTAWVNGNLINGIATIGSLGGKKYATGTCSGGSTVNVGFRPEFVFLSGTYANKEAFACITPQNDTDGYPIYHDTTQSTYERWIKQTNNSKVSVTDTGFIVGFSTVSAWTYFCIG